MKRLSPVPRALFFSSVAILGFRFAPPQAYAVAALRGLTSSHCSLQTQTANVTVATEYRSTFLRTTR
jgi:hypothetical protein